MSLTTPLKRALGLGSAKHGAEHWWLQRLTAIVNVPLILFVVIGTITHIGVPYEAYQAYMGHPIVAAIHVMLICVVFYHAQTGLQVVYEDYLANERTKLAALIATKAVALLLAIASVISILKIGFGA